MKEEIKALWTADLRANPDAQGFGALDYFDAHGKRKQCCLGRLCMLAVEAGVIPQPTRLGYKFVYGDDAGGTSDQVLPYAVQQWSGIGNSNPPVYLMDLAQETRDAVSLNSETGTAVNTLAQFNDRKVPSSLIADIIDQTL